MADLIPPPVIPQVASVPPAPRNRLGWVFLAFIFGALILLQAMSYFGRTPTEPLRAEEAQLRVALLQHSIVASDDPYKALLARLDSIRSKNEDAERLWVIVRYEDRQPIPTADLLRLQTSKLADGIPLWKLYSSAKLTALQEKAIYPHLGKGTPDKPDYRLSTRLARVHAQEKAGLASDRSLLAPSTRLPFLVYGLLSLVGILMWIGYFACRSQGLLHQEGHPATPMTLAQADGFAMRAAQLLAAFILIPIPIGLFVTPGRREILAVSSEAVLLLVGFYLTRVPVDGEIISLRRIGFRSDRLGKDIAFGFAGFAMNLPVVLGLSLLGQWVFQALPEAEHPIQNELAGNPSGLILLALFFTASIAAPLFEETLFRGLFLPAVSRVRQSPVTGAVITSILFATIHPTGIPAWPALAAIGGMSCLLAYQTRSLVPSMVMHCLHNALMLWVGLSVAGSLSIYH